MSEHMICDLNCCSVDSIMDGISFFVNGTKINFPFSPYPAQKAIMDRTLRTLKHSQNCLVESPTGTGKSLALLCAALAWQREFSSAQCSEIAVESMPNFNESYDEVDCNAEQSQGFALFLYILVMKYINNLEILCSPDCKRKNMNKFCTNKSQCSVANSGAHQKRRVPKIFYATRTHKQLSQMVRELKKTEYKDVRMTIMASRDFTCLNDKVNNHCDKVAACLQVKEKNCLYYKGLQTFGQETSILRKHVQSSKKRVKDVWEIIERNDDFAWDIEELVEAGRKLNFCPYFASVDTLYQDANLIFCPYGYLIDPVVRSSSNINLKGQVIIFDEAHNMEDECCEKASFQITKQELISAVEYLSSNEELVSESKKSLQDNCIQLVKSVIDWIDRKSVIEEMTNHSEKFYTKIWSGRAMYAELQKMKLHHDAESILQKSVQKFSSVFKFNNSLDTTGEVFDKKYANQPLTVLEKLILTLKYIYKDYRLTPTDSFDCYSYKLCLKKEKLSGFTSHSAEGWLSKKRLNCFVDSINFWCMNPGVIFQDVSLSARSVILASGTLAPLKTYANELGLPFQYLLEAPHVILPERVWIGATGVGPKHVPLKATYQLAQSTEFQDELGRLLIEICKVTPDGVLCFLPSYTFINCLLSRWKKVPTNCNFQVNSLWSQLNVYKMVLVEPRKNDSDVRLIMDRFTETIKDPTKVGPQCNGALLLAVYRGKISEGVDFADQQARAVVTVGIPYPDMEDLRIRLKMQYNNERLKNAKCIAEMAPLISGNQWYQAQAFRALNQALGRCLRHKLDWGALLLVDSRFQNAEYSCNLSTWIRKNLRCYNRFDNMICNLQTFVARFKINK
ncbi:Fanconi anemia group J -like protein [Trichinella pseudospiralis]|uniref:DNA 5'-3' helicase n=1 Tax=Trichinella pseudospiralis TaxID=6337 RepID=A0A0V1I7P9_TRIPS|nr:Fanconi anemia group J -like protein [Trichinella pseudospiralis]KRZ36752.1 Fanconi anemia group J -like protein [Trichinella pseudospiralis]